MFASLFLLAAAQISIPLGKPPRIIEQPRAPIERAGPLWASPARTSTTGTSRRRRCGSTATLIMSAPAGSRAILITGSDGPYPDRRRRPRRAPSSIAGQHRAARLQACATSAIILAQPRAFRPCRRHRRAAAADRRAAASPRRAPRRCFAPARAGRGRSAGRHAQALSDRHASTASSRRRARPARRSDGRRRSRPRATRRAR